MLFSMSMGCVSPEMTETIAKTTGGVFGSLVGDKIHQKTGLGRTGSQLIGGLVGITIGGAIARYLTKQDQKNVQTVFETGQTNQKYSWCSVDGSRSITTGSGSCASGNKISVTPQNNKKFQHSTYEGKRECRVLQIEVLDENGQLKSDTQTVCGK